MAKPELHMPAASYTAVSSEQNLEARARAWAFVFDCYRKKEAASSPESHSEEAERRSDEIGASNHFTE